jgi:hypothetical protein
MPSLARDRIAETDDSGVVEDRHEDVEGTTIQFVTIRENVDAAPLLRCLPDDRSDTERSLSSGVRVEVAA